MITTDTIIAGSALVLTFYGIYTTNRHNRLSVIPHLVGSSHLNRQEDGLIHAYSLFNHGIGPAKIKKFILLMDGKEFTSPKGKNRVEELVAARVAGRINYEMRICSCPGEDYSIAADQEYKIIEIFIPRVTRADDERIKEVFKEMHLRVEYESFYGERFVFDTRD